MVDGIPVTSVARTQLDLAWKLRADRLPRVLARSEELGLLDLDSIHAVIERNRGHHGAKRLRYALAIYAPPTWTRSDFERHFVDRLLAAGLPRPATGWNEVGYEIDVYWPERRFGIELGAYETHGTRQAFETDHEREFDFAIAGVKIHRVSERQFRRDPAKIVADVGTLLFRREERPI